MLAWLVLKDRHHKSFSRDVRESTGSRKAGKKSRGPPLTQGISYTQTHSVEDTLIIPEKNQVSIIVFMFVARKS